METTEVKNNPVPMVEEIMMEFAGLTGLFPQRAAPQRYLWTDAFAVCNFLGLYAQTGQEKYRDLAIRLIDQVHGVLGRHREDDGRKGWVSGLGEKEGEEHPTAGGLRIGKKMRERGPSEPFDEALEWDRDGQYFHYLTKWMHALHRAGRVTEDQRYHLWATELALKSHSAFTYVEPSGRSKRIHWKRSIDLSRPLVPSMGLHDPLDGLITYSELEEERRHQPQTLSPDLLHAISDMVEICAGKNFMTDDPLGIGGLLSDAYRVGQLIVIEGFGQKKLLLPMLKAASEGLRRYRRTDPTGLHAEYRLAFRELGLSIGIRAASRLQELVEKNQGMFVSGKALVPVLKELSKFAPMADEIESFWTQPPSQSAASWAEHREINMVMLATSLMSDGYLSL